MATGIPTRREKLPKPTILFPEVENVVSLEYPGKKSKEEILCAPQENYEIAWEGAANPNNQLYLGENLSILIHLLRNPNIANKINLIYIDPPFSTQTVFQSRKQQHAYSDILSGASFIEFLRERIILLHELLAKDGSFYLHLDEKMIFQMKIILDEIFGPNGFKNCITRKKCNPKNYTRKKYGNISDYILFYTKSDKYVWNKPLEPWTNERAKEYQYIEENTGRRFMKVPVHAPGVRNGETGLPWRGMLPPPGKHWQFPPRVLDEIDARGEIYWSNNGNPRRKVYLDNSAGIGVQDIWLDFKDAHNQNICITGYPTEKNSDLIRRIIESSSNPGDLVLDCFAGSGTTMHVASSLGRKWIGIDNSIESIQTIVRRFLKGVEPMGDFVHTKSPKPKMQQPTLFESVGVISERSDFKRNHKPILDFTLYSETTRTKELTLIVNELNQHKIKTENNLFEENILRVAAEELRKRDCNLGEIISRVGPCRLEGHIGGFPGLAQAIISQQLSDAAASSIIERFSNLFSGKVDEVSFQRIDDVSLKNAGLSDRKISYLRDLAFHLTSGKIVLDNLSKMTDEDVIQILTQVKGIGRWTAEMYLMFSMKRLDIFPLDDGALKSIVTRIYNISPDCYEKEAPLLAETWRPYRSVACWYLYSYLNENKTNNKTTDGYIVDTVQA